MVAAAAFYHWNKLLPKIARTLQAAGFIDVRPKAPKPCMAVNARPTPKRWHGTCPNRAVPINTNHLEQALRVIPRRRKNGMFSGTGLQSAGRWGDPA